MEQEQIVKSYDPVIMRRLLGYLKPYRLAAVAAVIALFAATAGELLLPIVLQRTLDNVIFVSFRKITPDAVPDDVSTRGQLREIRGVLYIPETALDRLHGTDRTALMERGEVSAERYFVFPLDETDAAFAELAGRHPESITAENGYGAVSMTDLSSLPDEDERRIRRTYLGRLTAASGVFLGLLVTILLFSFVQIYLMAAVGQDVMKDLRRKLFDHVLHQSLSFISRNPVGRLVTRLTNDVETVNELFTSVVTSLLRDVSLMIGVIAAMFLLNVRLGFITALTLPAVLVVTAVFRTRARDAFRSVRLQVSKVNSYLSEHLSGVSVVQLFSREKRSENEFFAHDAALMKANLGEMYVFATFRPVIDFLSSLSTAVVLGFGAWLFLKDIVSLGILIAFLNLVRRFYEPVMDLSEKYTILQSAMAGGERVFALLDEQDRIPDTGTGAIPRDFTGRVVFENVSFGYKEDEPVLKNLSFRIEPGETVAIVGYTGAGKTTITNLLTRLWDADSGRILLDGIDIREFSLSELRRAIQPVQQDVFIFTGTVEDNIRLGSTIPAERIRRAAAAVHADGFISRLPNGYATAMSEGGANISSGQRQLLAFARVIAHDPRIIIMDEATGSIDTETEKLIQKGIDELVHNRTALIIAHRLSTIRHADRIFVLAEGRLVEDGTHDELLARGGVYYNLYKLQYAAEADSGRSSP